jgi:hypothetical protein
MNSTLREVSPGNGDSEIGLDRWRRVQRIFDRTSRSLAARRVGLIAEQDTERLWFWRLVRMEVERARRRDVGFTILCIRDLDSHALELASNQLRPLLRGTDAVTAERDRILVLLSETPSTDALHVTRRLAKHVSTLDGANTWQEVSFPRDALTLGALIACLLDDDAGERLLLAG